MAAPAFVERVEVARASARFVESEGALGVALDPGPALASNCKQKAGLDVAAGRSALPEIRCSRVVALGADAMMTPVPKLKERFGMIELGRLF